jgi:hypothetical protein
MVIRSSGHLEQMTKSQDGQIQQIALVPNDQMTG